ncbi:hypothetical protein AMTRI_Chr02g258870 [Amborella trichopoda]
MTATLPCSSSPVTSHVLSLSKNQLPPLLLSAPLTTSATVFAPSLLLTAYHSYNQPALPLISCNQQPPLQPHHHPFFSPCAPPPQLILLPNSPPALSQLSTRALPSPCCSISRQHSHQPSLSRPLPSISVVPSSHAPFFFSIIRSQLLPSLSLSLSPENTTKNLHHPSLLSTLSHRSLFPPLCCPLSSSSPPPSCSLVQSSLAAVSTQPPHCCIISAISAPFLSAATISVDSAVSRSPASAVHLSIPSPCSSLQSSASPSHIKTQ